MRLALPLIVFVAALVAGSFLVREAWSLHRSAQALHQFALYRYERTVRENCRRWPDMHDECRQLVDVK